MDSVVLVTQLVTGQPLLKRLYSSASHVHNTYAVQGCMYVETVTMWNLRDASLL